jgi:hypothetical protein
LLANEYPQVDLDDGEVLDEETFTYSSDGAGEIVCGFVDHFREFTAASKIFAVQLQ